jgi:hypothetical protein
MGVTMRALVAASCVLGLSALAPAASADSIIERYTRSDGVAGLGAFESTTIQTTSPTAQREETRIKFTGGFMSAVQKMAGLGDSVRITRLDRDLVWTLDAEKRTYVEEPLTAKGERGRPAPGTPPPAREKGEPSDVVVTRNEFKVEKTGASKTINGFPCEEYLMTWLVETRNQKTGETGKSLMTNRLWTTPETAEIRAAQADEQAYTQAYLTKLGLEMSPAEAQRFLAGLSGLGEAEQQKALARVAAEMAKVQGYTIVSQLEWTGEGKGGDGSAASSGGGGQAGAAQVLGQLGKLFGGGKKEEGARSGQERGGPIFALYTEIRSIRTMAADPSRFEVPAGYTRK